MKVRRNDPLRQSAADGRFAVVTQVFPDEFHLHTLDQFLSATARLNPHVNIKAIVIGLMDRLSAYAQREAQSEPPEERKKSEEEAMGKLLERLRVSKESKTKEPGKQQNGDAADGQRTSVDTTASEATAVESETTAVPEEEEREAAETESTSSKKRGIPDNVRLFEIFHEQVASLVKMQRLPIQDIIALLVSLTNLAL